MSLVLSPPPRLATANVGANALRRVALAQPGLTERALVVVTAFVLMHEIPNSWVRSRTARVTDFSNPTLVAIELGLIAFAFVRVAGSIDHLFTMVRSEPLLFAFTGLTFASTFWSADPALTFRRSILFLAATLYATYLVMRFSLEQIIRLLAVMFVLSSLVNIAFILALPQYGIDAAGHLTGVFYQKNALGYVAAIAIPTLIVAARSYPPLRLVFLITIVLEIGLLWGSNSKTMLVATALPTALMVVYHGFRGRRTLRGAVIVSLLGSTLLTIAFVTANIALLAKWLNKDVSLTGRVPLWQNLLPIAMDKPYLGHGYGATFNGYFSPIHEVWIQNRWNPSHAHNALLQIWLEVGIFAVILFVVVYLTAIVRATKVVAIVPGAVGLWPLTLLTTSLMMSITESGPTSSQLGWTLYVVAVLSVSLHLRHRSAIGLSNDLRVIQQGHLQLRPGLPLLHRPQGHG
jgi:exopolysaccharide production protein ExoQ